MSICVGVLVRALLYMSMAGIMHRLYRVTRAFICRQDARKGHQHSRRDEHIGVPVKADRGKDPLRHAAAGMLDGIFICLVYVVSEKKGCRTEGDNLIAAEGDAAMGAQRACRALQASDNRHREGMSDAV